MVVLQVTTSTIDNKDIVVVAIIIWPRFFPQCQIKKKQKSTNEMHFSSLSVCFLSFLNLSVIHNYSNRFVYVYVCVV